MYVGSVLRWWYKGILIQHNGVSRFPYGNRSNFSGNGDIEFMHQDDTPNTRQSECVR